MRRQVFFVLALDSIVEVFGLLLGCRGHALLLVSQTFFHLSPSHSPLLLFPSQF